MYFKSGLFRQQNLELFYYCHYQSTSAQKTLQQHKPKTVKVMQCFIEDGYTEFRNYIQVRFRRVIFWPIGLPQSQSTICLLGLDTINWQICGPIHTLLQLQTYSTVISFANHPLTANIVSIYAETHVGKYYYNGRNSKENGN